MKSWIESTTCRNLPRQPRVLACAGVGFGWPRTERPHDDGDDEVAVGRGWLRSRAGGLLLSSQPA